MGSSEHLVAEPDEQVGVAEEKEDAREVVLERSKATRSDFRATGMRGGEGG